MKCGPLNPLFDNVCRICSCKHERSKLKPIFGNNDILEKITTCLPTTIHMEDNLPHEICEKCTSLVDICFKLVKTARSSEKYFFDRIKAICSKKIKQEDYEEYEVPGKNIAISLDLDGYQCDICGVQVSETMDLETHIKENHIDYSAPPNTEISIRKICSLCGQLFDGDESYVIHKCESEHSCQHCNMQLATKCLLNRHIQHYCKEMYFCPHCHDVFSDKVDLVRHVQTHFGEELKNECLACNPHLQHCGVKLEHTCDKDTDDKEPSVNKYKCYICGQRYKRQLNLVKHCLQHEPKNEWRFKCNTCDKTFEKERWLQNHYQNVHGVAKSWTCGYCGKSLSTKLSLQIHERIHTDVKPFVCEWCGNAFRSKANLIQHHAKHTGIRRHKCEICGKMFSRTFFLKTHMRVHTGERPYECDLCGQRFTQVGDMRRHRNRHNRDTPTRRVIYVQKRGQHVDPDIPVIAIHHTQQFANQEFVEQEFVDQELVDQELVHQELNEQDLENQELEYQQLENQEFDSQEIVNQELVDQETVDQQMIEIKVETSDMVQEQIVYFTE